MKLWASDKHDTAREIFNTTVGISENWLKLVYKN